MQVERLSQQLNSMKVENQTLRSQTKVLETVLALRKVRDVVICSTDSPAGNFRYNLKQMLSHLRQYSIQDEPSAPDAATPSTSGSHESTDSVVGPIDPIQYIATYKMFVGRLASDLVSAEKETLSGSPGGKAMQAMMATLAEMV